MDKTEKIKRYNCPLCKYTTDKPSDWIKHTNSKKHERNGKRKSIHCDICNHESLTHWNNKMHMITNHSTKEERIKQKYYCFDCDQVFFCSQYKNTHDNSIKHKNIIMANKLQKELDDKIILNNLL
jgi:hypothetical protein